MSGLRLVMVGDGGFGFVLRLDMRGGGGRLASSSTDRCESTDPLAITCKSLASLRSLSEASLSLAFLTTASDPVRLDPEFQDPRLGICANGLLIGETPRSPGSVVRLEV